MRWQYVIAAPGPESLVIVVSSSSVRCSWTVLPAAAAATAAAFFVSLLIVLLEYKAVDDNLVDPAKADLAGTEVLAIPAALACVNTRNSSSAVHSCT